MPAPLQVDSNVTNLPVWSVDNSGNVIQVGTLTLKGALIASGGLALSGNLTLSGTGTLGALVVTGNTTLDGPTVITGAAAGGLLQVTNTTAATPGDVLLTEAAAANVALAVEVAADTVPRFTVGGDGKLQWGGGAVATDTDLYRYAADGLATDAVFKLAAAATLLFGSAGDVDLYRAAGGPILTTDNQFAINTAGLGLSIKEGTNAKQGVTAAMTGGTITVATTAVTANSRIFLTAQTSGAGPGALRVSARTAGTSFTITSTSGTDTSTVAWFITEPA